MPSSALARLLLPVALALGALTFAGERQAVASEGAAPPAAEGPGAWRLMAEETFENVAFGNPAWRPDEVPDDGLYSDQGSFFTARGVRAPRAFRLTQAFGEGGWLTVESYTRREDAAFGDFASPVSDPAAPANTVLRIASREHTDATIVRPSHPLPERYRISLRLGFPRFGDGLPGLNGYDDTEHAGPWWPEDDARKQNGFYWLAILDTPPSPHNNTWIHHQRKVVIDSDNHFPAWMEIFDGQRFVPGGEHPVMMFAIDGNGQGTERTGKPFLAWADGQWQPAGQIRAVDAYLPDEWYRVAIERDGDAFTLEVAGRFRHGGQTRYRATLDARQSCVFHFNRPGEAPGDCDGAADGGGWPDFFMFGDPHSNYYEGEVLFDDVRLEVPAADRAR